MDDQFTKLFRSITTSTIWMQPDSVRIVWITLLALKDKDGCVWGSVPGLAHIARVKRPAVEKALQILTSPDPDSRTPDHDGRRITEIDGGWQILNHEKYRDRRDNENRREYERTRKAEQRAQKNKEKSITSNCPGQSGTSPECPGLSAHTDTDTDTDTDISQDLISSQETPTAAKKFAALCEIEFNENIWPWYPKRQNNPKAKALRAYTARRRAGAECEAIRAGVLRYARYCEQRGIINTEFIKQAATFFGPEKFYEEPWNAAEKTQRLSAVDRVRTANNL